MLGPFSVNKKTGTAAFPTGIREAVWYRTGKPPPYVNPLPYQLYVGSVGTPTNPALITTANSANCILQYWRSDWCQSRMGVNIQALHNKVYAEFLDSVRQAPAIGTDLAEYKETLKMASSVAGALLHPLNTFGKWASREARQIFKGGGFKSALEVPLKLMPNAWLAWHFGVDPLIKDYYSVLERLAQPANPIRVVVKRTRKGTWIRSLNGQYDNHSWKIGVKLQGEVIRIDDNLALWNDCGLLNPAAIAWELVPFSFVVDWFYPVGAYLSGITDLLGYKVKNPQRVWRGESSGWRRWSPPAVFKANEGNVPSITAYRFERSPESLSMKLQRMRAPGKVSAVRGFTAISLLLGGLASSMDSRRYFSKPLT